MEVGASPNQHTFPAQSRCAGDALSATLAPVREFMLANTRRADMATVLDVARLGTPETLADIPTSAVASAWILRKRWVRQ